MTKLSKKLQKKFLLRDLKCFYPVPIWGFSNGPGARVETISLLKRPLKRGLSMVIQIWSENKMQIRPLHDRVIVKRLEAERTTASGIVLPDTAGEKPDQGEVLAVGPGKRDEAGKLLPMDVKVGDRVLFGKYAGQTVKVNGEELLVMREEDIMGVLE